MKKTKDMIFVILGIILILIAFYALRSMFPNNIINKILSGASLVLQPVLISAVILYIVSPFTKWLTQKWNLGKKKAIAFTMVLFFAVFVSLAVFSIFFLVKEIKSVADIIINSNFIVSIENWFTEQGWSAVYKQIYQFVNGFVNNDLITNVTGSIGAILGFVTKTVATIILVPIFLWHLLNSQDRIGDIVEDNIPNRWKKQVMPVVVESHEIVSSYFKSKIISMIILFIMFLFLYAVLGLDIQYVILFSFLIASLDLIPYIGPTMGMGIPLLFIFSKGGLNILYLESLHVSAITGSLILLGVNMIIQFIQGNILIPALSGKELDIHPGLILVFMLFLGAILGVWGIILSIPLGGIFLAIWQRIKQTEVFKLENPDSK